MNRLLDYFPTDDDGHVLSDAGDPDLDYDEARDFAREDDDDDCD